MSTATQINAIQIIDEAKVSPFTVMIIALCCLCSIVEGFEMIVLGMIIPNMARDWGIRPEDFQYAHLAVVLGILCGSIIAGIMTDKIGRRRTMLIMFGLAAIGMGVSMFVQTMTQLVFLRFATGFGAGGSLSIAMALVSEYAPVRYRNLFVAIAFAGAPFASTVGGFIGPFFLDAYDWPGMFFFGFIMAFPLLIVMFFMLPESIKFLVSQGPTHQSKSMALLVKVDPSMQTPEDYELVSHEQKIQKAPVIELFSGGRALITSFLWVAFIGGQFVIYFVSLWMPTVLQANGWDQTSSLNAIGQYYLGASVGGILIGYLGDQFGIAKVLAVAFPLGALSFFLLGLTVDNHALWFTLAPLSGAIAVGAIAGKAALATRLYPTAIRGTGVGSAMGMGRFGGIITPAVGAAVVASGITASAFFNITAIAPLVSATAIISIVILMRYKAQPGHDKIRS